MKEEEIKNNELEKNFGYDSMSNIFEKITIEEVEITGKHPNLASSFEGENSSIKRDLNLEEISNRIEEEKVKEVNCSKGLDKNYFTFRKI